MSNYIFSLQPTFTQGLILGQLSVLLLVALVLKYLFLDSTESPFETSYYHPRAGSDVTRKGRPPRTRQPTVEEPKDTAESSEWFNFLLSQVRALKPQPGDRVADRHQVVNVYRSKLRNDIEGTGGDEIARKRVEDYANKIRPAGFLVRSPSITFTRQTYL